MDAAEKADLLARITKAQSVGATILSNMTAAKKLVDAIVVDEAPAPVQSFGPAPGHAWRGAYTGATEAADLAFDALVGHPQEIASTYYGADRTTVAAVDAARIKRGVVPLMSFATRSYAGHDGVGGFQAWGNIAAGVHDDHWRAVGASLRAVDAHVLVSFDQEAATRIKQSKVPDSDPAHYVAAFRRVASLLAGPKVHMVAWMAGNDAALEDACYPGDDVVEWIGWDPYHWAHDSAGETATQTFSTFADHLDKVPYGKGKRRAIFETGSDQAHGSAANAAWWASIPAAIKVLGLSAVILFDRIDGPNRWVIDSDPAVVAAYAGSLE